MHNGQKYKGDLKFLPKYLGVGGGHAFFGKNKICLGESHGLVVKADGSRSRGRGFKPRHCILDGCKRCQLLHKPKNNENKGSRMGHTKKIFKKKIKKNKIKNLCSKTCIAFFWWFGGGGSYLCNTSLTPIAPQPPSCINEKFEI